MTSKTSEIHSGVLSFFASLPDSRVERTKLHLAEDIVFISIASVICGADTWDEMEEFGNSKIDWLKSILQLPNGIPSHDTFNRFFASLNPEAFEKCFLEWTHHLVKRTSGSIVSIDGKTIRGSKGKGNKSAIHMVSAWVDENQITLGQLKVQDKSNEITAIPMLLDALLISGSIVTIDAMGCQVEIAKKILSKDADYLLAVKGNQSDLLEDIQDSFRMLEPLDVSKDIDYGHGRIETRTCSLIKDLSLIDKYHRWPQLNFIVRLQAERYHKATQQTEYETRYYITSNKSDAGFIGRCIRSHWGIENRLHWVLDVAFLEDKNRKRAGNAAHNASVLNRIALNLLKKEKKSRRSVKGKRLKAGWDNEYLLSVLEI